jgi:hypothetical protein
MADINVNFWDERYSSTEYIYGTEPNIFFKEYIDKASLHGKLLLPGEGEGRNAVYAAKLGWDVDAFDQSRNGKIKALRLASNYNVSINYSLVDLKYFEPHRDYYDLAAMIFVHLDSVTRSIFHKRIIDSIKLGGKIIIELFSKNQLGKNSGGPQDLNMLCSVDDIRNDFKELKILFVEEKTIYLNESEKHRGEASVVRFIGEKIK